VLIDNIDLLSSIVSGEITPDFDFFGDSNDNKPLFSKKDKKAPKLRDLHSDDLEEFMQMFVFRCDDRAFNRKIGYWKAMGPDARGLGWQPETKGKVQGNSQYIPAIRKHLTERLERHLDLETWQKRHRPQHWQQPYVLGLLGGEWSSVFHLDIDNHGGRRIEYHRDGQNLIVPDLSLSFLKVVKRVLSLPFEEAGMPAPCSLNLSSDSLGLYLFFVPELPMKTADGYGRLNQLAEQHGLKDLSIPDVQISQGERFAAPGA